MNHVLRVCLTGRAFSWLLVLATALGGVASRASGAPPAEGQIAIFKDDIPPAGAPSSPEHLARLLEAAGFGVAFLDAGQLAEAQSLSRVHFDVLVLPYGASFPVKAADNFRRFLRDGGKFLATGGYAFDHLLERTASGWRPPSPQVERLNTHYGRPEDGLEVAPTQLGVFDADYPLERADSARAAPSQSVVAPELALAGPLAGWAAAGVTGFDSARWLPLLNAYDRYGRLRGAVGAMLRHSAGTYAGSSWAFFGITNRDLFAASEPRMGEAFVATVRSLAQDTYTAWLASDLACYRPGEKVKLLARLFNGGRRDRGLQFTVEVYEGEPSRAGARPAQKLRARLGAAVSVPAGQAQAVTLEWKPGAFGADFYYLLGQLWDGEQEIDRIESAFMIWDQKAIARGPALSFGDNYLRLGKRPMFLFGTDDWSYTFTTRRETPLAWLRDMRLRRDLGVQIYENLQFGIPQPDQREVLLRKVDGLVQLAQKYQQVYFAGLLVGYNVAVGDAELEQQAAYVREFARRYARVPGLIYYLNGDLRCQLGEAVTPQFNQFLGQRYGDQARLRQAWGQQAPPQPLGQIPAEDFNDWGHRWDDVRVYDLNRFRAALIRRWSQALVDAIHEFDPAHPTSSEFYQLPHQGVDILAAINGTDLCNFGYFDKPGADIARFPAICKYNDQRARGKSVGPGEYGVKTHPAWGGGQDYGYHTRRTREQAVELFLNIAHYSLGLGASRIHNWCWKDSAHRVFPWGMVYPCDEVPKEVAYAHRNQSLLFRQFAPVYRPPEVYVLTADSHRLGGGKWQVVEGILKSIDLALATHVPNLGTLNEDSLLIPKSARLIFYPLPFCPTDETYEKVRDWVQQGGVLYVSGDISYDEFRQRTRTGRLEQLCGVKYLGQYYPDISVRADGADQPCLRLQPCGATVRKAAKDGSPLLVENRLGRGQVLFSADPFELHSVAARRQEDVAVYRRALALAGVRPLGLQADDGALLSFCLPLQDGGRVCLLFNTDANAATRRVVLSDARPAVSLSVARGHPALLWWDGRQNLRAVEALTDCTVGGRCLVQDDTRGIVLALDGLDLPRSGALLLLPLETGTIRLANDRHWQNPMLLTGDLRDGQWWNHETTPLQKSAGGFAVHVSPDQAVSLLLLTEEKTANRWRRAVERMVSEPASLR